MSTDPTTIAAAPVADAERVPALDLVRGTAILGILAANIPWFSGTGPTGPMGGGEPPDATIADNLVKGLTLAFVEGKFISQLAVLFGAGLALQADRAWAAGRHFTGHYLWRTFLLFLIGLAHATLLWYGDILVMYSFVSVAAVLFVRLRPAGLLVTAGAGLTLTAALLSTVLVLEQRPDPGDKEKDKPPPGAIATPESVRRAVTDVVNAPPEERGDRLERFGREVRIFFDRDNQVRVYQQGSYGEQVFDRAIKLPFLPLIALFLGGDLLACFLFGAFLVRAGFFGDRAVYRRWRPWLLGGGLMLGVPMQVASLILTFGGDKGGIVAAGAQLCGALGIAVVYLTLVTGWAQTDRAAWLQERLKAVGRLALTNYLAQTVICTTIFYSFGYGLYGTLGRPATLLVVVGVWLLQLLVSPVYLRFFRIGPVEWVWRSLSLWRVLPLRRERKDRAVAKAGVDGFSPSPLAGEGVKTKPPSH